jgi:hypothetical protein
MPKWFFDLTGEKQDAWRWLLVADDGAVMKTSHRTFAYYLDCVADAERHGYKGPPSFRAKPATAKR